MKKVPKGPKTYGFNVEGQKGREVLFDLWLYNQDFLNQTQLLPLSIRFYLEI